MNRFIATFSLLFIHSLAAAATYQVGPGRTYPTLQSVAGRLHGGDVVLVDGGVRYSGQITFRNSGAAGNPITIRGLGTGAARPVLATAGTFAGGSVVRFWGHHYVFENFDVDGERDPNTGRGLHVVADDVTIRDCVVHDVIGIGIHGSDSAGALTLERCEVHHNGEGDRAHQIYVATDNERFLHATFRMIGCHVHDGIGGSNVKSRAARSEIYGNWIEGAVFYELDLIGADAAAQPPGSQGWVREDADVVGNIIVKRNGPFSIFARIGSDGAGTSNGRYRFVNNTFSAGAAVPASTVLYLKEAVQSLEAFNNVFHTAAAAMQIAPSISIADGTSGAANWASVNTTIPAAWTGTITSAAPGWSADFVPLGNGALFGAGVPATYSPAGFPFPSPLLLPLLEPNGAPRLAAGAVDIGAFEAALPDGSNVAPTPVDDVFVTNSFGTVSIPVLGNDTDADGDTLEVVSVSRGVAGEAGVAGGMVTWKPGPAFTGSETLRYAVSDGHELAWAEVRVVNPFVQSRGVFHGLIGEGGDRFSGALRVLLTNTGTFTGTLRLSGVSHTVRGTLGLDGRASVSVLRRNLPTLAVALELEFGPPAVLRATIADGTALAEWEAPRIFHTGVRPLQTGVFTVLFATAGGPPGTGYGSITIGASGASRISGALADGRPYSATGDLRHDGTVPFSTAFYGPARGGLHGTIAITGPANAESVAGTFLWWKPTGTTGLYPEGFSHTLTAAGFRWMAGSYYGATMALTLSSGGLETPVHCTANVPSVGLPVITGDGGGVLRTFEIKRATGLFTGRILHPLTAREIVIGGAVLQPAQTGGGSFIGTTESGRIELGLVR